MPFSSNILIEENFWAYNQGYLHCNSWTLPAGKAMWEPGFGDGQVEGMAPSFPHIWPAEDHITLLSQEQRNWVNSSGDLQLQ